MAKRTLRSSLERPLTFSEMDENFVYSQSVIGEWNPFVLYGINALIARNGTLYKALNENINSDPNLVNNEDWTVYQRENETSFPISQDSPLVTNGEQNLYFQILGGVNTNLTLTVRNLEGTIAFLSDLEGIESNFNDFEEESISGLNWTFFKGEFYKDGIRFIGGGTLNLEPNATNYIEIDVNSLSIVKRTDGFQKKNIPIRKITTNSSQVTSSEDKRTLLNGSNFYREGFLDFEGEFKTLLGEFTSKKPDSGNNAGFIFKTENLVQTGRYIFEIKNQNEETLSLSKEGDLKVKNNLIFHSSTENYENIVTTSENQIVTINPFEKDIIMIEMSHNITLNMVTMPLRFNGENYFFSTSIFIKQNLGGNIITFNFPISWEKTMLENFIEPYAKELNQISSFKLFSFDGIDWYGSINGVWE